MSIGYIWWKETQNEKKFIENLSYFIHNQSRLSTVFRGLSTGLLTIY